MDIWEEIKILEKSNYFFRKATTDNKIASLNRIMAYRCPSAIRSLIPFLKNNIPVVRNLTCEVIFRLLYEIRDKNEYYRTLKGSLISPPDIDYYCKHFSRDKLVAVLIVASHNHNGYVREKAVRSLAETQNSLAIPHIIYRLGDWVPSVRAAAQEALQKLKTKELVHDLTRHINVLENMQFVERVDLSPLYSELMEFVTKDNKELLLANFKSYPDKVRITIAKYWVCSGEIDLEKLRLMLSDNHLLIRKFPLNYFDLLTKEQVSDLLNDKSAGVRYATLYKLRDNPQYKSTILKFVSDNSSIVRSYVRYTLREDISDFGKLYHDNLINGKNIIGSICGIAEVNAKQYIPSIEKILYGDLVRAKKYAFLAMTTLDENRAFDYAIENLGTKLIGLRKLLTSFLSTRVDQRVLEKARMLYSSGDKDTKLSMLKLFSNVGKWLAITDLMIGTIDDDVDIREMSAGYIVNWKIKAASGFMYSIGTTQPPFEEIEKIKEVWKTLYALHEEKKYFYTNPLREIDFYLTQS